MYFQELFHYLFILLLLLLILIFILLLLIQLSPLAPLHFIRLFKLPTHWHYFHHFYFTLIFVHPQLMPLAPLDVRAQLLSFINYRLHPSALIAHSIPTLGEFDEWQQ